MKAVFVALLFIVELLCMKHFYVNHSVSQLFVLALYCVVVDVAIWQSYCVFLSSDDEKKRDNCSGRCAQLLVLLLAAFAVAVIWDVPFLARRLLISRILLTGIKSGSYSFF